MGAIISPSSFQIEKLTVILTMNYFKFEMCHLYISSAQLAPGKLNLTRFPRERERICMKTTISFLNLVRAQSSWFPSFVVLFLVPVVYIDPNKK